jgi:hypothetical protein
LDLEDFPAQLAHAAQLAHQALTAKMVCQV